MATETRRPRSSISPRPLIKSEPIDSDDVEQGRTVVVEDKSLDPISTQGHVECGQCRLRRASLCCMEEVCVEHAQRKWRMTTMLICEQCDKTIHGNPVMTDHIRSILLIRGFNCLGDASVETEYNSISAAEEEISGILGSDITISTNVEDSNPEDAMTANPQNPAGISNQNFFCTPPTILSHKTAQRKSVAWPRVEKIHNRYARVLQVHLSMRLSPSEMFRTANVPRQTLLDTVGIAELRIVDPRRYEEFMQSVVSGGGSGRVALGELERGCRAIIREHCRGRVLALRGTKLLPLNLSVYNHDQ